MLASHSPGKYFQVGPVVVEIYGGKNVVALGTRQLQELHNQHASD
jgi:hypothetical protein